MRPDNHSSILILAAALSAAFPLGCGNKGGTEGTAPAGSGSAAASGAPAGSAAPATGATVAQPVQVLPKGIGVEIKDLQFFHPYSTERSMPNVRDNGAFSTRDATSAYGLGVIVEVTNGTGEVLTSPWFEGSLQFINGDHVVECKFNPDNLGDYYSTVYSLSFNEVAADAKTDPFTGEKPTAWRNENSSTNESVWRPGERVRLMARRNECESAVLADMPPAQIHGKITVRANKPFVKSYASEFDQGAFDLALLGESVRIRDKASGYTVSVPVREYVDSGRSTRSNIVEMIASGEASKDSGVVPLSHLELRYPVRYTKVDVVESAPTEFDLPATAMTMQMVKLASGDLVHASGNVLVYPKDNKVVFQDMAKAKLSLLGITREEVPAAMPEVSFTKNELSGNVKSATISDYVGETSLTKGQRKLTVVWNLRLQGEGIDRRLRVPFDIASGELDKAVADLGKVDSGDAAAVADAKSTEAKARSAKNAAETKYKTGLKSEREKVAKAFPCGDVKVATNKTTKAPSNGKAVAESCKALVSGSDDLEVTMTYTLERYELPVALVYSLGGDFSWSPVASAPLLKLESR